VKNVTSHSQRAQTQSHAARELQRIDLNERFGTSPKEFSDANRPSVGEKPVSGQKVTRLSKAKVKRITARREGNQAASEQLLSEKLCRPLTYEFARQSAEKTGDHVGDIASIRVHYQMIVRELLCVRSSKLLSALEKEYARDRKGLMRFLSAMLKHWQKIHQPDSLTRVRAVVQRIAPGYGYSRKRILDHMQEIGLVPKSNQLTVVQQDRWLTRIGQYLSRDQRAAIGKDFGFRDRPKPRSFGGLLKPKSKEETVR
jgi:hypothetical protein